MSDYHSHTATTRSTHAHWVQLFIEGIDEVRMVIDGKLVLPAFLEMKPDMCVLDIMLPSQDGYSIAKSIRQQNSSVPIIFVTAKTQTDDLLKGFEVGGNDYLRKPFSMEELIVRVNNLLQLTQRMASNTKENFSLGQFEFIPQRYELRNGPLTKKLSSREAMLLQLLCENKNAVVSRKYLLMKVWGDDSFFNSRNMDVYITKLRDYLKEDPSIEIITIKGVGYHFAVA